MAVSRECACTLVHSGNAENAEGFWVADFADRSAEALERLASWIRQGKLIYREDIVVGFEHTPVAFIKLLGGANFGKQLVQL